MGDKGNVGLGNSFMVSSQVWFNLEIDHAALKFQARFIFMKYS